jgi:hypothetical protein
MDKAFDLAALEARLKAAGLPALEGVAEIVAKEVFGWLGESCAASENVLVKSIGPAAIAVLQPLAMAQIDKIDGQPG